MKILWLRKMYFDVAVGRAAPIEMIRHLKKQSHKIIFVTGYKKKKHYFDSGDELRYAPSLPYKYLNHLSFLISIFFYAFYFCIFWRPHAIIVDVNTALVVFPVALLRRFKLIRTKIILDVRTIPVEVKGVSGKIEERLFDIAVNHARNWFDAITVITPAMKHLLTKRFDLAERRVGVWTSGVSLYHFDPRAVDIHIVEKLRKRLGLQGKFVLIYHGVITVNRGLKEVMAALNLLREDYPNIVFIILGAGAAEDSLREMVHRMNLADNVRILNAVPYDYVANYIFLADAGILPFPNLMWWRVSSPLKLLEYLAMNKPVIVTEIEAHRSVLDGKKCAFFVASNDPRLIAERIAEAYQIERDTLRRMGEVGREIVRAGYTWDIQAQKLTEVINGK